MMNKTDLVDISFIDFFSLYFTATEFFIINRERTAYGKRREIFTIF